MGGLYLLGSLLLNSPRNPELCSLVAVLEIEKDNGLRAESVRVDIEQFGVNQGLNISEG